MPLIELAYNVLKEGGMQFQDLFAKVSNYKGFTTDKKDELVGQFYTRLILAAMNPCSCGYYGPRHLTFLLSRVSDLIHGLVIIRITHHLVMVANFEGVSNNIIQAIVDSNATCKGHIAERILAREL